MCLTIYKYLCVFRDEAMAEQLVINIASKYN